MSVTTKTEKGWQILCACCGTPFTAWDGNESEWWDREDWLLEWWSNDESGCWVEIDEKPYCEDCVVFNDEGTELIVHDGTAP